MSILLFRVHVARRARGGTGAAAPFASRTHHNLISRRAAAASTPGAMAPPIDRQRALQNFGTPQIMDKLLVKFPETVNPTMEWLRSAVEQGNVRDMKVQIRSHGPRARVPATLQQRVQL